MTNIVLLCAAGMSTSMLVQMMRRYAKEIGYECRIEAYPIEDAERVCADADIVLLGPQVRFRVDQVKEVVSCPVELLDMEAYGTLDGKKALEQVREVIDG